MDGLCLCNERYAGIDCSVDIMPEVPPPESASFPGTNASDNSKDTPTCDSKECSREICGVHGVCTNPYTCRCLPAAVDDKSPPTSASNSTNNRTKLLYREHTEVLPDERDALTRLLAGLGTTIRPSAEEICAGGKWRSIFGCLDGHITAINLSRQHPPLRGRIDGKALARLSHLRMLYLHNNELRGSIPNEITTLRDLSHVLLHRNRLTGPLPERRARPKMDFNGAIAELADRYPDVLWQDERPGLHRGGSGLERSVPVFWGDYLRALVLYGNKLAGTIPASYGEFASLWILDLSFNRIRGTIPRDINKLMQLEALYLNDNRLEGAVPPLQAMGALKTLRLDHNTALHTNTGKQKMRSGSEDWVYTDALLNQAVS